MPPSPISSSSVRMSDVARAAGVSLVTVSRVVNEPERVKPDTLRAVRSAIEQLGYVPNLMAGSLASKRSRIVAAIVPTISNLVFSETIEALTRTLADGGYQLLLGQSGYRAGDEAALVDTFLGRRVDGLVLTGEGQPPALRDKLRRAGLPVVQTWELGGEAIDMQVGFSNHDAGRAAAEHLIARGHRALAFIGAQEARSQQRLAGFRAAAAEHGVSDVPAELIRPPALIDDAGPRLAQIVAQRPEVTAVFCNNDLLAAGVLFECRQHGWDVPGRMAVLGFGDLAIARAASPRLSTVQIRRAEIGERAGQMLLARLSGENQGARTVDIGFEVIARAST
ncbi:LacI family DNA-binding transcriptional regulator [Pseudorhodoferax soli]|uniref:LacI family DNA-binding transcriptional regulator n=1 Tax=Pseudorhodoferax soli TaxID=545864 RepID=UPI001473EC47|nr:LacI family DNA-binding transcriptional regulator [Pseudorhodoferax soli]